MSINDGIFRKRKENKRKKKNLEHTDKPSPEDRSTYNSKTSAIRLRQWVTSNTSVV